MKRYSVKIILVVVFWLSPNLYSQTQIDSSISMFEFRWSNDFEYNTDYYFTNGFAFEFLKSESNNSHLWLVLIPSNSNDETLFGFSLVQNIYTPKAKFYIPDQLNGDRPFAAYILIGLKKLSYDKKLNVKVYSELQTGILGPAALGEETQNGIHSLLPTSSKVNGWENQISNSFMLNYSASIQKYLSVVKHMEVSGFVSSQIGIPYTNAGVGVQSRIGMFNLFPEEFKYYDTKAWQYYLTLSAELNVVGYNATLQGGLLSKSIYTINNINHLIGKASIGFTIKYKIFSLKYSQQFITPEFSNGVSHSWGFLSIIFKL